jgi:hypothetical protein
LLVELALKVIDRCIDLVKRRQEINRNSYTDFVLPAFMEIEGLFKEYSDGLRSYRDTIEATDKPLNGEHSILRQIARDRMFSEGLIARVRAVQEIHDIRGTDIKPFVSAVIWFVNVAIAPVLEGTAPTELSWPDHIVLEDSGGKLVVRDDMGEDSFEAIKWSTARTALIHGFTEILQTSLPEDAKRRRMLTALDTVLQALQANYALVVHEHLKVRKKALAPL